MRLDQGRFELGHEAILPHDELRAAFVLALALVQHRGDLFEVADRLVQWSRSGAVGDCRAGGEGPEEQAVSGDALDREEEVRLERDLRVRRVGSTALQVSTLKVRWTVSAKTNGTTHLEPALDALLLTRREG